MRSVLDQAGAAELGYGDPRGAERLRRELAGWLARSRGIRSSPEDIIIVAGVAQSLALLAQVLHAHGQTGIAVEDPGSRGARDELAHWGLQPVPVAVDDQGLRVDELARAGLPAALLTPAHQFPTGVVLAPQRRRALLHWATADGAERLVIEDDYDAEYRYDRAPVGSTSMNWAGPAALSPSPQYRPHPGRPEAPRAWPRLRARAHPSAASPASATSWSWV